MARSLGKEGFVAFERGDLAMALDRFGRAYRLHPVPTLALWTGRVLARMGRLVAASERLHEARRLDTAGGDRDLQQQAQRDAEAELEALRPRIPSLRIEVRSVVPEEGELRVDGEVVSNAVLGSPMPLDPGDHEITLRTRSGSASARVQLAEGEHKSAELSPSVPVETPAARRVNLQPRIATTPETGPVGAGGAGMHDVFGWGLLGLGAAGLVTWGATGLVVLSQREQLDQHCQGGRCPPDYHDDLDRFRLFRTISTVGFYTGLAGVAAGTALILSAPSSTPKHGVARVRAIIGVNGIAFSGEY